MKKLLVFILTAVLMLSCLTACDLSEEDKCVTIKEYENCAVFTFDNLPERETATFELTRTGLGEGAIYYHINLERGSLGISYKDNVISVAQSLGQFTADDEMPINGSGGYIEGDKIEISFGALSPVKGEIIIAFTEDALKAVHGSLNHHEHTGEWIEYNQHTHYYQYTCGCTLPDRGKEPHENYDADMFCDVCGFNMSEIPTPTNHFLRDQAGCEWLNDITAEDIAEIKIISEAVGVAPGTPKNILSSTDENVIARIFEEYYWLDTTPISKSNGEIDGGGAITVKFILKDETEKELYINNGNYRDPGDDYFELLYTPNFNDTDSATKTYGFVTYVGTGTVYDGNNNSVCEIPVDELEYVIAGYDFWMFDGGYEYYVIDTEFGKLYFAKVDIFASEGGEHELVRVDYYFMYEYDTEFYYRLVGKNLDELIADVMATEYSLTMNDEEWLYEDIKSTSKAGETVTVKIEKALDLGYLFLVNGKDIATCIDGDELYWEFTFTMPACDVEIDFKTYDGFLPDWNYGVLIKAYWKHYLDSDFVYVENYYGEFPGGAIVAMITSGEYDQALWEETVGNTTIRYNNGNRIIVLYEGDFYTLTAAYENGYLSSNDLEVISELQKEFYPFLY